MSLVTETVTVTAVAGARMVVKVLPTNATETALIVVESVVLALAEPPPETVTELTWGEVALLPTFTVTVIG